MKKHLKQLSCLALALVMALCALPALAGEAHGPLWIEGAEGKTLTYCIPIDSQAAQYFETYAEHPFFQWMEEQTGVHVEFIHPSWEQMEQQFNLMMTSGNYYDILYYPTSPDGPQAAIDDGLFADINNFKDLMPHYFEAVNCGDGSFSAWEWGPEKELYYQGPQPAFADLMHTVRGNMWAITQIWTDRIATDCGAVIRQDWLDEAGLPIPETLEDLEKVLAAFKARGENVVPMSLGNNGYNANNGYIVSAFDINMWYSVRDGVVQPQAWTTPEGKEYVTLLRDWYKKGYIDRDFMNRDGESLEAMFLSDRLGILHETWTAPETYEGRYVGESEGFKVSPLPLARKTTDQQLRFVQTYNSEATNYSCIAAQSQNKELAAQWMDRLYTKEAILRGQYGVENESYVLDENGVPYFTKWFYEHRDADELLYTYLEPNMTCYWSTRANVLYWAPDHTIEGQKTVSSDLYKASRIWGQNANPDMIIGYVTFDGTGWSDMYDPYVEAETYALPMMLKIITGTEDLANFDAIAQKALDMGYREARDKMQTAYNLQHQQPEDYGMNIE